MNRFVMFAIAWFILSSYGFFMRPPAIGMPLFPHFDKFTHAALFFGQLWLVARAYALNQKRLPYRFWLVLALIWAIAIELIQSQLPSRSADVWDVVADMVGAIAALYLAHTVYTHRLRMKESK